MAAARGQISAIATCAPAPLDDDDEDEFKPLFDYSDTVPPAPHFLSSDDSDDDVVVIKSAPPKLEITPTKEPSTPTPQKNRPQKEILDDDDDDDDDSWLMSPSKMPKLVSHSSGFYSGNHALHQLRLQRMELQILQQKASPEAIRRVEELARLRAQQRPEAEPSLIVKTPQRSNSHQESPGSGSAASEKEKILLKVQNNSGSSQSIRIFATDKFEKLFKVYANLVKVPLEKMVFRFDGDQISHNSTPKELDLEDNDVVEVYIKS